MESNVTSQLFLSDDWLNKNCNFCMLTGLLTSEEDLQEHRETSRLILVRFLFDSLATRNNY